MKFIDKMIFEKALSALFSLNGLLLLFLILLAFYMNFLFVVRPLEIKRALVKIKLDRVLELAYTQSLQTLRTVEGPLIEAGLDLRVLKIKQGDKIFLRFLKKNADNSYWFINAIELKGSREAYFNYRGEPFSLSISDDEGDGSLDIIAPAFDKFFWPHINLAFYNKQSKKFELRKTRVYSKITTPTDEGRRGSFFSCGFWCHNN